MSKIKKVKYKTIDGKDLEIEYDENASCIICGLPVIEASMGGTTICCWCDCGYYRNSEKFTLEEVLNPELIKKRAKEKSNPEKWWQRITENIKN